MMSTPKELFDQRLNDLLTTTNHQEPKRVPVCMDVVSWATAYSGGKTEELVDYPEKMASEYVKVFNDVYCDCILDPGVTYPIRVFQALGAEGYIISSDGVTIQHCMQDYSAIMKEDEYDLLIADPAGFSINVMPRRKYKNLNGTKNEAYAALLKAALEMKKHMLLNRLIKDKIRDEFGIVELWGNHKVSMQKQPFDFIQDGLRGMKGILIDLKRQPENLLKAIQTIGEISLADARANEDFQALKPWPFMRIGLKVAEFIGLREFRKYWWPLFVEMYKPYADVGVKIFVKCEGLNGNCLDLFRDFPKNSIILQLERDDPFEVHQRLGDVVTIAAGITASLLKYGTKQQCIDYVKKAFDTFAPGGGFMLIQDRPLLSANDAKIENVLAVYEFAKEYAKY